jgi:hypothetical protein
MVWEKQRDLEYQALAREYGLNLTLTRPRWFQPIMAGSDTLIRELRGSLNGKSIALLDMISLSPFSYPCLFVFRHSLLLMPTQRRYTMFNIEGKCERRIVMSRPFSRFADVSAIKRSLETVLE